MPTLNLPLPNICSLFLLTFFACTSPKKETPAERPMAELELEIKAELGEGAFWNHQNQTFYFVDILGKKLHLYKPATNELQSIGVPSLIGTVVPANDQQAIIALEDGIYIIETPSGQLRLLSAVEAQKKENRFNDGKCDPAGRLWVGSMNLKEEAPTGTVYRIGSDGAAHHMIDSVTISNGIVWSSDQKTMYYIDTPTGEISAYDYDVTNGQISNKRTAVKVPPSLGFPDGMAIDAEDKLWVGLWNGNAVARFDPVSGQLLSKIEVPAHNVTACAFGGTNLDTLYITTASVDMTAAEQQQFPLAGSIFKAVPGVNGVPSPLFLFE